MGKLIYGARGLGLGAALARAVDAARINLIWRLRYLMLRALGYESANPRFTDFRCSRETLAASIGEIMVRIGAQRFDTVLDYRCGAGDNSRVLRTFANRVYGADTIPLPFVSVCVERYVCLSRKSESFATMQDGLVDAIFVLNRYGFNAHSTWRQFLSPDNDEVFGLLKLENFPRLLKPGGFLIFSEWEARPEERWGKLTLDVIESDASKQYDPPQLEAFELVACGVANATRAPFVAYRRV